MTKRYYPAVLESGGKGTFGVWFPDFPDCVAAGTTRERAIAKAELVLSRAVDVLTELEQKLPEPTPVERIVLPRGSKFIAYFMVGVEPPNPSERVNIYLPRSLIARADKRAAELGMSRSSFFGLAVTQAVGWTAGMAITSLRAPRSKAQSSGDIVLPKRSRGKTKP